MLAYVTVGADDLAASGRFYDATLGALGFVRLRTGTHELGYGEPPTEGEEARPRFWVVQPFDGGAATFGNGVDVCFAAPSRAAVDAFHAAALATGGRDEGAPGLRLHYSPLFYTAYVRDPVGNKLNALCDSAV